MAGVGKGRVGSSWSRWIPVRLGTSPGTIRIIWDLFRAQIPLKRHLGEFWGCLTLLSHFKTLPKIPEPNKKNLQWGKEGRRCNFGPFSLKIHPKPLCFSSNLPEISQCSSSAELHPPCTPKMSKKKKFYQKRTQKSEGKIGYPKKKKSFGIRAKIGGGKKKKDFFGKL